MIASNWTLATPSTASSRPITVVASNLWTPLHRIASIPGKAPQSDLMSGHVLSRNHSRLIGERLITLDPDAVLLERVFAQALPSSALDSAALFNELIFLAFFTLATLTA